MTSPQQPSIGRIVLVRLTDVDATTVREGSNVAPAIIVDTDPNCVCVRVFTNSEAQPLLYADVPYVEDASAADAPKPSWSWPPRV